MDIFFKDADNKSIGSFDSLSDYDLDSIEMDSHSKEPSDKKNKKMLSLSKPHFSLFNIHKRNRSSHDEFSPSDTPPLPTYKDKSELSNAQLNQANYQLSTFKSNFALLKSDFTILEEYEKKFFKNTTLDVMFIMDITGSMGMWLGEAKNNITTIIEEITDSNPCANIRVSFVGYRDYVEIINPVGQYVSIDFTSDIHEVKDFISKIDAYGGGDEPEDIAGAFQLALNMHWQSEAKYAVLVCDAPCHGSQYHKVVYDKYGKGDPNGLVIEDLIKDFVKKGITLYCVEINDSTSIMFDLMKKIYDENGGEFHVETLGDACSKLPFFVAFGASVTLSNVTYNKVMLEEVVMKFREDTINMIVEKYHGVIGGERDKMQNEKGDMSIQLINQIENLKLDEKEQKMFEFINRMSSLNINSDITNKEKDINNKDISLEQMSEWLNKNDDVLIKVKFHYLKITIDQSGYNLINWKDLATSEHSLETEIKFNITNHDLNSMNIDLTIPSIPITIYDTFFGKTFSSQVPPHIHLNTSSTLSQLLNEHSFNSTLCSFFCSQFNFRLKDIIPSSKSFLKCVTPFLYEIPSFPLNYFYIHHISNEFPRTNTKITNKLLDAFCHFTYQFTEGNYIIMNITTNKESTAIQSFTLWKKSEDDYGKLLKFFVYHVCNDICKKMNLMHPRKKKHEIIITDEFYLFNFQTKIKLCDVCLLPIISKDSICSECNSIEKKGLRKKEVCSECRELFSYSPYVYRMKILPFPKKCNKCTFILI